MNQPTPAPTRKVAAGTTAGAAALLIVWVAGLFGQTVPAEVAAAIVLLGSTVVAYFTRERRQSKH